MEDATDVQDVRVVHVGLGPLGAAIARAFVLLHAFVACTMNPW